MTHLNHLSLYVSQVAWFLPVSFVNVQIYFLVLLLMLNTIESDGFLWRLKTLFLAHSCFQTKHSSFLEPACLPNTRILLCRIRVTMLMIQDIMIKAMISSFCESMYLSYFRFQSNAWQDEGVMFFLSQVSQ